MHDHLLSPWRQGLCQSSYVLCGGSDGIGEEKKEEVPVIIPVETEKEVKLESIPISI